MYAEYGLDMCPRLRGMFAFAIYDGRQRRVMFGRDRFGKKPLYIRRRGGETWFASELKAVAALSSPTRALNVSAQGVYDYLSLGAVPQPSTIYDDVESLPPGYYGIIDQAGALTVAAYWQPTLEPDTSITVPDAIREVRRVMSDAVELRLHSDVPVGVLLSGGIDSSIIAVEASRHLGKDLQTYSIAAGEPSLDEADIAARTAAAIGIHNERLPLRIDVAQAVHDVVRTYAQPFADSSAIPSLQVAKLAGENVRVVLNGDGGDELFGGYRRHVAAAQLDRYERWVPRSKGIAALGSRWQPDRRSRRGLALRLLRGIAADPPERYLIFTHDMFLEQDHDTIWRGPRVEPSERLLSQFDDGSRLRTQMLDDIRHNLASDLLVKMDIACMTHSVEGRSPFLDAEVASLALRLPDGLKVRRGVGKWILRRAYERELSHEVLRAPKRGFEVPLATWMEGPLKELIADTVNAPGARVGRFVDTAVVNEIFDGNRYAERNSATIKYSLLMLELWLRSTESEVLGAP
jgi:asparagine synthase (glutamine-hydrolysing)